MQIGPYETVAELGRGGVGVVYRARSSRGGEVAVKVLLRVDGEALARFDRERRLLSALGAEKGFVPIVDSGTSAQGPYVVMPLLTGGTLRDRLRRGALTIEGTLELGRTLARALGEAHALGIVHRDLKPENVLFDARGRPLVADLGLAKHFRPDAPGASQSAALSRSGAFRGTAGYMAPEQAADASSVGPQADVFALGAILYEALAGRPAFDGVSVFEVLAQATQGRVAPLRQLRPDVPVWLAAAVERALARDPASRPHDAIALGRSLEPPGRRRRPWLAVAGVAACVAVVSTALALRPREAATPPRPRPPTPVAAVHSVSSPARPNEGEQARARELVQRGDEKRRAGDLDGALADYDQAIALDPGSSSAWSTRGFTRLRKGGQEDGAIADLDKAIELAPMVPGFWTNRGAARVNRGDLDGAIGDFDRAIELAPRFADAWGNRGYAKLQKGDLDGAIADGDRAIALDPKNVRAYENRGLARQAKGDRDGAIADFERLLELDPGGVKAPAFRERITALRSAATTPSPIDADGERVRDLIERGVAKLAKGDRSGALADLDEAVALEPKSSLARAHRGDARRRLGDLDAALADLERAIELDPANAVAWRGRGVAKDAKGDHDGAIVDLGKAIELDPTSSVGWRNRAVAKQGKGDHDGAIADYTRALELDPRNTLAWHNRGSAKVAKGDREGAIADYTKAIELDPEDPRVPALRKLVDDLRSKR